MLRNPTGKEGMVAWSSLKDERSGRVLLAYGGTDHQHRPGHDRHGAYPCDSGLLPPGIGVRRLYVRAAMAKR
jgi:hypothetical protein